MHRLSFEPLCEPNIYVFLYYAPTPPHPPPPAAHHPPPPPPHALVDTTDRSKVVVTYSVALWLILLGDLY